MGRGVSVTESLSRGAQRGERGEPTIIPINAPFVPWRASTLPQHSVRTANVCEHTSIGVASGAQSRGARASIRAPLLITSFDLPPRAAVRSFECAIPRANTTAVRSQAQQKRSDVCRSSRPLAGMYISSSATRSSEASEPLRGLTQDRHDGDTDTGTNALLSLLQRTSD